MEPQQPNRFAMKYLEADGMVGGVCGAWMAGVY
jgi:hypothetical protein